MNQYFSSWESFLQLQPNREQKWRLCLSRIIRCLCCSLEEIPLWLPYVRDKHSLINYHRRLLAWWDMRRSWHLSRLTRRFCCRSRWVYIFYVSCKLKMVRLPFAWPSMLPSRLSSILMCANHLVSVMVCFSSVIPIQREASSQYACIRANSWWWPLSNKSTPSKRLHSSL